MNMVCTNCGYEAAEEMKIKQCPECGTKLIGGVYTGSISACKVFLIIGIAVVAPALIPLAWVIPMTVYVWRRLEDGRQISTGMKVAVLLLVSVISGIILLANIKWHDVDEGRKILVAEGKNKQALATGDITKEQYNRNKFDIQEGKMPEEFNIAGRESKDK